MFVVRNTLTPEADIERGWSAWIGREWNSQTEALRDLAVEAMNEHEAFDVRFNESYGRWMHVHHEGLSAWLLDAETETEAWTEAREGAAQDRFPWYGFGVATVGTVRLVGHVADTLYLFECDDVTEEE